MSLWMVFDHVWSPQFVMLGYNTILRATLFLLAACALDLLLRNRSAHARAALWTVTLAVLLPLPLLRSAPFAWRAEIMHGWFGVPWLATGSTLVAQSSSEAVALPWTTLVASVWLCVASLLLLRLACGLVRLHVMATGATRVSDGIWLEALAQATTSLPLRRRIRLLRSTDVAVPCTWGVLRPVVVLPPDADEWSPAQRRTVLLHELAHVRRSDAFTGIVAQCACAVWWFHPGAWYGARRLRIERERACDARVLAAGIDRSAYAELLLDMDLFRQRPPAGVTAAAFAARASDLHERISTVLRAAPRRPSHLGASAAGLAGALLCAVLGSMRLAPQVDLFWPALESRDWAVRAFAAESIARTGDAADQARLADALRGESVVAVHMHARFGARLRAQSAR